MLDRVLPVGRNLQCDRHRHAGVEVDRLDVERVLLRQPPLRLADDDAAAQRVRARDVVGGELLREQLREMVGGVVPRVGDLVGRVVVDRIERHRIGEHVGLIVLLVFLIVNREAGVEQQLVALRARVFRHGHEASGRRLNGRRFRRNRGRDAPVAAHLVLLVVVIRDLILRRQLEFHASREAADVSVVDARTAGVGRIRRELARNLRIQVVEAVDDRLVDAEIPERAVEPRPVADDRPADADVRVVVLGELADVGEEVVGLVEGRVAGEVLAGARLTDTRRPAVVRRPARRRVVADAEAVERVAAILRDHVDAHAALAHLGRIGAGHVAELLEAAVVPVHAAVRAVGAQVVEAHALRWSARCRRTLDTAAATAGGCRNRRRRAKARRRRRPRWTCPES